MVFQSNDALGVLHLHHWLSGLINLIVKACLLLVEMLFNGQRERRTAKYETLVSSLRVLASYSVRWWSCHLRNS